MRHKWINVYKALGAVPGTQITLGNAGYSYVMTIIYAFSWVKAESAIRERCERDVWEWVTGGSGNICSITQSPAESTPSLCP